MGLFTYNFHCAFTVLKGKTEVVRLNTLKGKASCSDGQSICCTSEFTFQKWLQKRSMPGRREIVNRAEFLQTDVL